MTKDEVFGVVQRHVRDVLPEVSEADIRPDRSMRDLGANSLDRMDVLVASIDELGIEVPVSEFAEVKSIGGLVDALHARS
jgi:polyketide biosynthesis acyl carrier protein